MSLLDFYPAFALVAVIGGAWTYASIQRRRLQKAVTEVAARLKGNYRPGGHLSGGTLTVTCGGRDIVFVFNLSHSARSENTSIVATLTKPAVKYFHLRGREAIARAPWLRHHSGLFAPVRLEVVSNMLQVDLHGIVRTADGLVDLATEVAALAGEVETP
jgi:hypothetical protein